jgi:hypothetical protein
MEDAVINRGPDPAEWMVLYHGNLGWPLLSPETLIDIPGQAPSADTAARFKIGTPREEFEEISAQYVLDEGHNAVSAINPELGLALHLQYSTDTLPWLNTWRLLQKRRYVLALKPSSTRSVAGRVEARKTGDLSALKPGETQTMRLGISLTDQ